MSTKDPTESQRLLAHEFCRNWIASGHAVERMAVLLAEERAKALEEAALIADAEPEPPVEERALHGMTEREAQFAVAGVRATKRCIAARIRALKGKP